MCMIRQHSAIASLVMDQQDQGTRCDVCGNLNFEASDGLFFCLECGTQSQVFSSRVGYLAAVFLL